MDDFLTSSQVAALFGVTPMTITRWTDAGRLSCEKTAGKHRRYRRSDIEALRDGTRPTSDVEHWVTLLRRPGRASTVEAELLALHAQLGSWDRAADALAPVIEAIGQQWSTGKLSVFEEHTASEQLHRGLARVCDWLPRRVDAPLAVLATPEGEHHTLGLSLVELCLRAQAWETQWIGRSAPAKELKRAIENGGLRLLALSAAVSAKNGGQLAKDVRMLERACAVNGVALILGGRGAWPKRLATAMRFDLFADFARALPRL